MKKHTEVTMSKQSSIEYLLELIRLNDKEFYAMLIDDKVIEKAKQMHKEEIESAYCDGGVGVRDKTYKGMHEYYQKTYGGD